MVKMLFDEEIFQRLESLADQPEKTRSSFWEHELKDFRFTSDGKMSGLICIGNLSQKNSKIHKLTHWLLQTPYRYFTKNSINFEMCYTATKLVAERQGRAVTLDMLRQTLSLAVIVDNLDLNKCSGINLVIGDGYGVMSSLLKLLFPKKLLVTINLSTPLLIDLYYAKKALPKEKFGLAETKGDLNNMLKDKDLGLIGITADNLRILSAIDIGFAANLHSMQEMTNSVISSYFDILRSNKNKGTTLYCCNRIYKELYDGEKIIFSEYPWDKNDKIIFDDICPWDNFEYNLKPPFWHPNPNKKQHRLVVLQATAN